MRTVLTIATMLLQSLILAPVVLIARALRVPQGPNSIYERCGRARARAVLVAAGARVHVHGRENMPASGAVYISNHVSWFDMFTLEATIPRCSFVAKREIRRVPLFGPGAEAVGIVFIDRDNRKAAFEAYKGAAEEVSSGRSIVVCPEGTRGEDYRLRSFKKGPFVLAIAAQSDLVPTVVYGAREVMPKGSIRIRPGDIHVHVLPPVSTVGTTYDDRGRLMQEVWTRMADFLRERYGVESVRPGASVSASTTGRVNAGESGNGSETGDA
jgi:1-acyl-sn-glycerol-3-phosphate acyltransferase